MRKEEGQRLKVKSKGKREKEKKKKKQLPTSLHLSHFSHLSRENSSLLIAQVCHFVYLGCFLLKL